MHSVLSTRGWNIGMCLPSLAWASFIVAGTAHSRQNRTHGAAVVALGSPLPFALALPLAVLSPYGVLDVFVCVYSIMSFCCAVTCTGVKCGILQDASFTQSPFLKTVQCLTDDDLDCCSLSTCATAPTSRVTINGRVPCIHCDLWIWHVAELNVCNDTVLTPATVTTTTW